MATTIDVSSATLLNKANNNDFISYRNIDITKSTHKKDICNSDEDAKKILYIKFMHSIKNNIYL